MHHLNKDLRNILISIIVIFIIIVASKAYRDSTELPMNIQMDGVAYNRATDEVIEYKRLYFSGERIENWFKKEKTIVRGILSIDKKEIDINISINDDRCRHFSWNGMHRIVQIGPEFESAIVFLDEPYTEFEGQRFYDRNDAPILWVFSKDGVDEAENLARSLSQVPDNVLR